MKKRVTSIDEFGLLEMVLEHPTAAMDVHVDALDGLSVRREHEPAWDISARVTGRDGDVLAMVEDDGFGERCLYIETSISNGWMRVYIDCDAWVMRPRMLFGIPCLAFRPQFSICLGPYFIPFGPGLQSGAQILV